MINTLKKAIERVINSEDDSGCSGDLTVLDKAAVNDLIKAYEEEKGVIAVQLITDEKDFVETHLVYHPVKTAADFRADWGNRLNVVRDADEEWTVNDVIKEMEALGWEFAARSEQEVAVSY